MKMLPNEAVMLSAKAQENIESAEILFAAGKYNAAVSRAYYGAFCAARAALFAVGETPNRQHKSVQALFANRFFNRFKILDSGIKPYFEDLESARVIADYHETVSVSKAVADQQVRKAKEFYYHIQERILS
jgi:uncharacterized protein (UPF0332 family)